MRQGGGQRKGRRFESNVCKELSRWVSGNRRTDLFVHTKMSGGRATVSLKRGNKESALAGDVGMAHADGHQFATTFLIECKHYADLAFGTLVCRNKGLLVNFWVKARDEALAHHKNPVMIVQQNNMPRLWICDPWGTQILNRARTTDRREPGTHIIACFDNLNMHVYHYETVLSQYDANLIHDPYITY